MLIPLKFKYRDPDLIPVKSGGAYKARSNRHGEHARRPKHLHIWRKALHNR